MAARAVASGPRVGVVVALESTIGPTEALLREEAAAAGRPVEVAKEANTRRALEGVPTSEWSRGSVVRVTGWQWVEAGYATADPSPLGPAA